MASGTRLLTQLPESAAEANPLQDSPPFHSPNNELAFRNQTTKVTTFCQPSENSLLAPTFGATWATNSFHISATFSQQKSFLAFRKKDKKCQDSDFLFTKQWILCKESNFLYFIRFRLVLLEDIIRKEVKVTL